MPGQRKRKQRREAERRRVVARTRPEPGRWEVVLETQDQAEFRAFLRGLRGTGVDGAQLRIDQLCGRMVHPTAYRLSRFVPDTEPPSASDAPDAPGI